MAAATWPSHGYQIDGYQMATTAHMLMLVTFTPCVWQDTA